MTANIVHFCYTAMILFFQMALVNRCSRVLSVSCNTIGYLHAEAVFDTTYLHDQAVFSPSLETCDFCVWPNCSLRNVFRPELEKWTEERLTSRQWNLMLKILNEEWNQKSHRVFIGLYARWWNGICEWRYPSSWSNATPVAEELQL